MVAADQSSVTDLNTRAHRARVRDGAVTFPTRYARILHDDTHAGVGDQILTRHNQRRLPPPTAAGSRTATAGPSPPSATTAH